MKRFLAVLLISLMTLTSSSTNDVVAHTGAGTEGNEAIKMMMQVTVVDDTPTFTLCVVVINAALFAILIYGYIVLHLLENSQAISNRRINKNSSRKKSKKLVTH